MNHQDSDFDSVRLRAESGDVEAQLEVGKRYMNGDGVRRNTRTAVKYLENAAAKDNLEAIDLLGDCYRFGEGIDQDEAKAVGLYLRAAEKQYTESQSSLGHCYFNGNGVEQNPIEAVRWFRLAAAKRDVFSLRMLGHCYLNGDGVERDHTRALAYYKKASIDGDKHAQYALGECFRMGDGTSPNYSEALRWYRMAAKQGHPEAAARLRGDEDDLGGTYYPDDVRPDAEAGHPHAQYQLGMYYWLGEGVDEDNREAAKWLELAANQNHADAQLTLAHLYDDGDEVGQDLQKAFDLYERCAKQGHAAAMRVLGEWYMKGKGVVRDEAKGLSFFQSASQTGDHLSILEIGKCHFYGKGTTIDLEAAFRCFRNVAEQDEADSCVADGMMRLGFCLLDGEGCKRNEVEGVRWLIKSTKLDDIEDAENRLGDCYQQGIGVLPDEYAARKWFKQTAEEGSAEGLHQLGRLAESTKTRDPDLVKAYKHYCEAAESGSVDSIAAIGRCLLQGYGTEKDPERAFRLLYQAAKQKNQIAQYWLGVCCEFGFGEPSNVKKAARCYDAAARQGCSKAQVKLAEFYLKGIAVQQNVEFARRWLRFAIKHENSSAYVMLGYLNELGIGGSVDIAKAEQLYRHAMWSGFSFDVDWPRVAKKISDTDTKLWLPTDWFRHGVSRNDPRALKNLGICYLDGIGVPASAEKAIKCFEKSASLGLSTAQENLARCCENGLVEINMKRSNDLHTQAADAGDTRAKYSLGQCFRFGRGVSSDFEKARELLKKAADAGDPDAMLAFGEMLEEKAERSRDLESALRFYRLAKEAGNRAAEPAVRRADVLLREDKRFIPTAVIPDSIDDIGADLLPVVKPLEFFEFTKLRIKNKGIEQRETWICQELADHLGVGLVYDLPRAMQYVMREHIERWGVTMYEALERARDNLLETGVNFEDLDDGVFVCSLGDEYDAARILLENEVRELPVVGQHVAMIPNNSMLIVTGSRDDDGLATMLRLAKTGLKDEQSSAISPLAFRLDEHGWSSWLPQERTKHFDDFRQLRLQCFDQIYAQQCQIIGHNVHVAKCSSFRDSQKQTVHSICEWSEISEMETLLPETEFVRLVCDTKSPDSTRLVITVGWQELERHAGELMEAVELYPPRYRVKQFPARRVLDQLRQVCDSVTVDVVKQDDSRTMRRFRTSRCALYGHKEIELAVDASDEQAVQECPKLVDVLEGLIIDNYRFEPGQTLRYGWSILRFELGPDDLLTLHEPDFESLPVQYVPGVSNSVRHIASQIAMIESFVMPIGEPNFPSMNDEVTVCNRLATADGFVMDRFHEDDDNECADWMISCNDDDHDHHDANEYDVISYYELLLKKPQILDFLAFPPGSTLVVEPGKLQLIEFEDVEGEVSARDDSYLAKTYGWISNESDRSEVDLKEDSESNVEELIGKLEQNELNDDELNELIDCGTSYIEQGNQEEAIRLYTNVIKYGSPNAYVSRMRGVAFEESKRFDKALLDYNHAIELESENTVFLIDRARVSLQLNNYDVAHVDIECALRIDPNCGVAYLNRGSLFNETGNPDQAIADFCRATELLPEEPDAYNEAACVMIAREDVGNRDAERAIKMATTACELSLWQSPYTIDTLAAAFAEIDRFGEAVKWQKRAVELAPSDDVAEYRFRLNLYQNGERLRVTEEHPFFS